MPTGPVNDSIFRNMMVLRKKNRTGRVSSWDQTGANKDFLVLWPGETKTLADIEGPGIINHFYCTLMSRDIFAYRRIVVRMYWDDEETPSVEAPLGDFFGIPFAAPVYHSSLLVSINPGRSRLSSDGLNIYFPMPFAKRARIELFNDSVSLIQNFWYHINYETLPELEPDLGYFHACWRREKQCEQILPPSETPETMNLSTGINVTGDENYVILDAKGQGNYAGCLLQIDNLKSEWYGEGDDMIFIDGEKWPPSLHGTGTEEIFGGGACPNEPYFTPYCGFMQVERPTGWAGRNVMYKYFVNDPVRFAKSIRVTLEHGHANNMGNDYASTAYWYQAEPHAPLPALPDSAGREPRMPEEFGRVIACANRSAEIFTELTRKKALKREDELVVKNHYFATKVEVYKRDAEAALFHAEKLLADSEDIRKRSLG